MYNLLKVAVVMLALFGYTSAQTTTTTTTTTAPLAPATRIPSHCKCRHVDAGTPDNDPTYRCCFNFYFNIYGNATDYGCKELVWSITHHRCDCRDSTLYENRVDWSGCCNATAAEPDQGFDCALG